MTLLSTQINGTLIDTLGPVFKHLHSLDAEYLTPINYTIADYRETVTTDYSAYLSEWMVWGGAIATCVWDCTMPQREAFMEWAFDVEAKIAQFDWIGCTLSAIDHTITACQVAQDIAAVVWMILSFLWVTFSNHVVDPYEGSDVAARVRLHHQEMAQHQVLLQAADEAIAESQVRIHGIAPAVMDLDLDMGSLDAFISRFQETDAKEFDPLTVFVAAFTETLLDVKEQLQPALAVA
ncbi:MAG: hypothetical protein AAGD25_15125 [Cyanobacteria bacterium P01_F01_bin.150]